MKKSKNIILGVVIILIGVILLLKSFGVIDHLHIFFKGWWTLFIIVPAVIGLLTEKDKTGDIIALIIGVLLLLGVRDIVDFSLIGKLILPIILIIIGLSILFKDTIQTKVKDKMKEIDTKDGENYTSTFSTQSFKVKDEFKGSEMNAIFGGIDLDLTKAKIKKDTKIKMCCIFGGIDLFLPEDVDVKIASTSLFGGVDDKRKDVKEDSKNTIYIEAFCIFGGVDIK